MDLHGLFQTSLRFPVRPSGRPCLITHAGAHSSIQVSRSFVDDSFFKQLMECRWEHDHEVMACEGILPVPLHPLRKRERGYNQAAILARMVSDGHRYQWLDGVLKRIAPNPSQTMLSRSMRFKNMARAFEVQQPERIQGKKLLLIDDVLTSGATADACAQACLQAGATSVIVRTLVCVAKRRSSS